MTNTSASVGMQRINEVKNEVTKIAEEVNRIDYTVTTQEHELKTLSDNMCDLNSLKESVKEHSEEIIIIKEDYTRMKTHLNVSAKLELQVCKKNYLEKCSVTNCYLLHFVAFFHVASLLSTWIDNEKAGQQNSFLYFSLITI